MWILREVFPALCPLIDPNDLHNFLMTCKSHYGLVTVPRAPFPLSPKDIIRALKRNDILWLRRHNAPINPTDSKQAIAIARSGNQHLIDKYELTESHRIAGLCRRGQWDEALAMPSSGHFPQLLFEEKCRVCSVEELLQYVRQNLDIYPVHPRVLAHLAGIGKLDVLLFLEKSNRENVLNEDVFISAFRKEQKNIVDHLLPILAGTLDFDEYVGSDFVWAVFGSGDYELIEQLVVTAQKSGYEIYDGDVYFDHPVSLPICKILAKYHGGEDMLAELGLMNAYDIGDVAAADFWRQQGAEVNLDLLICHRHCYYERCPCKYGCHYPLMLDWIMTIVSQDEIIEALDDCEYHHPKTINLLVDYLEDPAAYISEASASGQTSILKLLFDRIAFSKKSLAKTLLDGDLGLFF